MAKLKPRITFLGTSGAWPTPRPGCACDQCAEALREPRLRRTRSSLLVEDGGERLLVDPGPDVWHQFVREGLAPEIGRALVTHSHMDHCLGIDDLVHMWRVRPSPLEILTAPFHQQRLGEVFSYLGEGRRPKFVFGSWDAGTRLAVGDVVLEGFETGHRERFPTIAPLLHVGERRIAYATDMGTLPEASRALLQGIDLLVGDGSFLGGPNHGHCGTDAVLALAAELGIGRVAFTHLGHLRRSDAALRRALGAGVGVARDGGDLVELLAE